MISLPVQTAVAFARAAIAAPGFVVGVQVLVAGLYRAPVLTAGPVPLGSPPHTTSSVPVHTAATPERAPGPLRIEMAVQVSVAGLYRAPSGAQLNPFCPPQTSISEPVQTATCCARGSGGSAFSVCHVSSVHGAVCGVGRS